jgi:flagellar basal-body rod protein FlgC
MANVNTVNPFDQDAFQERLIVAQAVDYGSGEGGVRVARAEFGSAEGRIVYEPDHPMANEEGYVRYPDIDLGDQMVQLLMAQRGYQANLAVVERATNAYQAALQLGKG